MLRRFYLKEKKLSIKTLESSGYQFAVSFITSVAVSLAQQCDGDSGGSEGSALGYPVS